MKPPETIPEEVEEDDTPEDDVEDDPVELLADERERERVRPRRVLDRLKLATADKEYDGAVGALLDGLEGKLAAEKARFRRARAAQVLARRAEYEAALGAVLAAEQAQYSSALRNIDAALGDTPEPDASLKLRRVVEGGLHLVAVRHECAAARVQYQALLELDFALAAEAHVRAVGRLKKEYDDHVRALGRGYARATAGLSVRRGSVGEGGVRRSSWG
ncbi:uncharacterized protein LOC62_01G001541 [Vanrija pseudolonga]|uniref:Uncharacterized protein n=1 Tax=Vanrija pseudolonga TaxID=143232 RepID=A0AAF0Y4B1_9TREE|nr:hypothetical protein LOC62_01G001541 [Vanrija pseudolonga]